MSLINYTTKIFFNLCFYAKFLDYFAKMRCRGLKTFDYRTILVRTEWISYKNEDGL